MTTISETCRIINCCLLLLWEIGGNVVFGNGNLPPAAAAATAVDPVSKLADLVSLWFSNAGRSGDFPVAKLFILGNVLKSPYLFTITTKHRGIE